MFNYEVNHKSLPVKAVLADPGQTGLPRALAAQRTID
jgi:hypothetical protein